MKNFFVIGDKASTSLSPLIFNHWFKKYNIQAKYSFLEVIKKNFHLYTLDKKDKNGNRGKPSTLKKSPLIDLIICGPSLST